MPLRTRAFFSRLDKDTDNRVTLAELQLGFEREFKSGLTKHAKEAIVALFEAHAKEDGSGSKSLKPGSFNRFYAEILFRHFDANNNGFLEVSAEPYSIVRAPLSRPCTRRISRRSSS